MGHAQMLRVSKVEGWLTRPRATGRTPCPPGPGGKGDRVIIRTAQEGREWHGDTRLHLAMLPPGTCGLPHHHRDQETAMYIVSGEAEVWHGPGLGQRSTA